tara:strand:+ start:2816 stop:3064 length:249 start_codon:yes stop_codon:yes gene_type:complete
MNDRIEEIAYWVTEGQIENSRLLSVGEAINKLHSAYCYCDDRNRAAFKRTLGKMTVMEAIEAFGDMNELSENVKCEEEDAKV